MQIHKWYRSYKDGSSCFHPGLFFCFNCGCSGSDDLKNASEPPAANSTLSNARALAVHVKELKDSGKYSSQRKSQHSPIQVPLGRM